MMSIEQAQAFIEKAKNDQKLIIRLYAAAGNEDRVQIARGEGFEFTKEELTQERERFHPGGRTLFESRFVKKNRGYLFGIISDIERSSRGWSSTQESRIDLLKRNKLL